MMTSLSTSRMKIRLCHRLEPNLFSLGFFFHSRPMTIRSKSLACICTPKPSLSALLAVATDTAPGEACSAALVSSSSPQQSEPCLNIFVLGDESVKSFSDPRLSIFANPKPPNPHFFFFTPFCSCLRPSQRRASGSSSALMASPSSPLLPLSPPWVLLLLLLPAPARHGSRSRARVPPGPGRILSSPVTPSSASTSLAPPPPPPQTVGDSSVMSLQRRRVEMSQVMRLTMLQR